MQIAVLDTPPARWVAGAGAGAVEQKASDLLAQVDARRDLSCDLAYDETAAVSPPVPRGSDRTPRGVLPQRAGSRAA